MWIDTHCHLDNDLFINSQQVISSSIEQNVNCIIIPAVGKSNFDQVIKLAEKNDECFYALGYHPMYLNEFQEKDFGIFKIKLAAKPQWYHYYRTRNLWLISCHYHRSFIRIFFVKKTFKS